MNTLTHTAIGKDSKILLVPSKELKNAFAIAVMFSKRQLKDYLIQKVRGISTKKAPKSDCFVLYVIEH